MRINKRLTTIFLGLFTFLIWPNNVQAKPLLNLDQPKTQKGWVSFSNISNSSYQNKLNTYKDLGYRVIDVEIRGGTSRRYSVVFRKNTEKRAWKIHTKLSSSSYSLLWNKYKNQGYRPIDTETYILNGNRYYAGIWIKNKENLLWASSRNLSSTEYNSQYSNMKNNGYVLIDIERYIYGNEMRYSTIWVKNSENVIMHAYTSIANFSNHYNTMTTLGYRLFDYETYTNLSNDQRYSAIWVKETSGRKWVVKRDMTSQEYSNWFNKYSDLGYRIEDIEVDSTPSGLRYAAVWTQNVGTRLNWQHKNFVNQQVDNFFDTETPMGMTVGIAVNGKIRYLDGRGFRDLDNNKTAHSNTIMRLASISKAITSTLGYRMQQLNQINLNNNTSFYYTGLPRHHSHSINQLLSCRSGVRHYNGEAWGAGTNKVYSSAMSASKLFENDALDYATGTDYKYSTHSYTLAAAAYEGASGELFPNLLVSRISTPFNLPTIKCESRWPYNTNRSLIYDTNGNKLTPLSLSWKYGGGGMEGSAYDVLRFGIKLVNNQILSATNLTAMTTVPDNLSGNSRYAFGWNIDNAGSTDMSFSKDGVQDGSRSYLRCYPNQRIVIVLLCNTRTSNWLAPTAEVIGQYIINN